MAPQPLVETSDPVLFDPFVGRKEPPPKKPPLAPAALAAALLALLPLGSLAAVFVGVSGLRQTKLGTMRGRWLSIASIALGALFTLAYASAGIVGAIHYIDEARADERHEKQKWDRKQREREEEERASAPEPTQKPVPPVLIPTPVPANGTVPQKTEERLVGQIPVVDLGVAETSLAQALIKQMALAKADGKEVMVMIVRDGCGPCADQMKAFADPLMQTALAKTRFVRVSADVFLNDLPKLQMRAVPLPWFYLLRADATPRDGINGGEWGEDLAVNIAPVLGPFARGELKRRKEPFKPLPPSGTFL